MAHPDTGAERRKFGRKPCRVKALIKAARGEPISCLVLDYSEGGARLELSSAAKLPPQFDLCFDELNLVIPCELRHMFGRTAGIQFSENAGRRSLSSAFGTEKLLKWLAQETRRAPDAVAVVPALSSTPSFRLAGGHPLRCSVLGKPAETIPDIASGCEPTTLTLTLIQPDA
ncbi:MAG: PilZ domain-containing protein [Hyphomicrobiaceae bacterium]|nr:PilZ domain-containing protein [Hyphomicrobiaceae bacterium]